MHTQHKETKIHSKARHWDEKYKYKVSNNTITKLTHRVEVFRNWHIPKEVCHKLRPLLIELVILVESCLSRGFC